MDSAAFSARYRLTRGQVAARLGVSTSSVRRMEFDRLHPVQDDRGVWRFDESELEGLVTTRPSVKGAITRQAEGEARMTARRGRLAARIFQMFARDLSLAQIVVVTRQPPDVVRDLYHEWSTSLFDAEWERERAERERM